MKIYYPPFSLVLLSLLFVCSCHQEKDSAMLKKEAAIDTLNNELLKRSYVDPKNLILVERLLFSSDSMGYTKGIVESSIIAFMIYFQEYKYPDALRMLENAKKRVDAESDPSLSAKINYYLGEFHFRINNKDLAFGYFNESIELLKQVNDTDKLQKNYIAIGNLFLDKQNWPRARKYLWLAYSMNLQSKVSTSLAWSCLYLGAYYDHAKKKDSAEFFYTKANQISEKLNNPKLLAYSLNNYASFNIDHGEFAVAENKLMRALKICDSIREMPALVPILYLNLGLVNKNRNQYSDAKTYLEKALSLAGSAGSPSVSIRVNEELYLCNKELNNCNDALKFVERFKILKDSNDRITSNQNLVALEMKYNYARLQKEQEAKAQRNKLLFAGALIAFGLIIVMLILLYQKQLIKIKNFKLKQRILDEKLERNNSELASHVLHMVSVNERKLSLIQILKEQLPYVKKENQPIVQKVIAGFESDQDEMLWKEFEIRFTEVHKEFYSKLAKLNPNLTLNEKRLCAFLLLNMTSKEIMCITGQSIKAIEQARFRLRKQLGIINSQVTLSGFLSSL
jgi:tetratricopeptide (TPR) repeat protein